jgi:hypothetical protein
MGAIWRASGLEEDAIVGAQKRLREIKVRGMITGEARPGAIADGIHKVFVKKKPLP